MLSSTASSETIRLGGDLCYSRADLYKDYRNCPVYPTNLRNPLVYAQYNSKRDIDGRKKSSVLARAFNWYTQDRGRRLCTPYSSNDQYPSRPEECDIRGFSEWLERKYAEYQREKMVSKKISPTSYNHQREQANVRERRTPQNPRYSQEPRYSQDPRYLQDPQYAEDPEYAQDPRYTQDLRYAYDPRYTQDARNGCDQGRRGSEKAENVEYILKPKQLQCNRSTLHPPDRPSCSTVTIGCKNVCKPVLKSKSCVATMNNKHSYFFNSKQSQPPSSDECQLNVVSMDGGKGTNNAGTNTAYSNDAQKRYMDAQCQNSQCQLRDAQVQYEKGKRKVSRQLQNGLQGTKAKIQTSGKNIKELWVLPKSKFENNVSDDYIKECSCRANYTNHLTMLKQKGYQQQDNNIQQQTSNHEIDLSLTMCDFREMASYSREIFQIADIPKYVKAFKM